MMGVKGLANKMLVAIIEAMGMVGTTPQKL